jgi:hypothetical protein
MGQQQSTPGNTIALPNIELSPSFLVERILAAECDFLPETGEQVIKVGAVGSPTMSANPLATQGIRIGSEPIRRMQSVSSCSTSLNFTFENNTELSLFKRPNYDVCYHLKTPRYNETRCISDPVRKRFKNIGLGDATVEIDKIADFMR